MAITPNPAFRPNPNRAIYVQGVIDQQMVNRLTPEIISLQHKSRDPITIYIDSPGGSVSHKEMLLNLLRASNQDFDTPCRLITVAASMAASAAADLLSAGHYTLAYPNATILYHGTRIYDGEPLTAEHSSYLAQHLRAGNNTDAMDLARSIVFRFMFRFISCEGEFDGMRQHNELLTDLDCFLAYTSRHLSEQAKSLLSTARERSDRYYELLKWVIRKSNKSLTKVTREASQIKAIVDFELKNNKRKKGWSFTSQGIHLLTDDFLLLNEYIATLKEESFRNLCVSWGMVSITEEETKEIAKLPEGKRTNAIIEKFRLPMLPIWTFLIALCHSLQQGENYLSASDAFWLGLIDEIIGAEDLPSSRLIREYKPDEDGDATEIQE
jgi:ATP-dependent protease ClpP protease subunit